MKDILHLVSAILIIGIYILSTIVILNLLKGQLWMISLLILLFPTFFLTLKLFVKSSY